MINKLLKMGFSSSFVFAFLPFLFICCAADFVPVLIWGNGVSNQKFPGLLKVTTEEFSDMLLKKVRSDHPLVLLYVEENLSVEDLSWRDADDVPAFQNVRNASSSGGGMFYLPSVQNPYHSLRQLQHHGYSWKLYNRDSTAFDEDENIVLVVKLDEPSYLDDRPDMLRKHDLQMAQVYNQAQNSDKKVMAIYTGHHSSWMEGAEANRVKREEPKEDPPTEDSPIQIADADMNFLVYVNGPIVYNDGSSEKTLIQIVGNPTTGDITDGTGKMLDIKMKDKDGNQVDFDMFFVGSDTTGFTLSKIQLETSKTELTPSSVIYGPRGYSYFCSQTSVFKNKGVSMSFPGLQVQGFVQDKRFGRPIDCIPYFSAPIWSGILVILLLGAVTGWGILMIMDINTNDRFDDPKGKTITISAMD